MRSMHRSNRRALLRGVVACSVLAMLPACEKPARVHRVGFLAVGSREGRAFLIDGFRQGLREHGYVEGRNISIEYRFSENRNDRLPELAAELVALRVDLIVASGSPASFAAKDATRSIPIVMPSLNADPVATGLIASLARPGGNITGLPEMAPQLSGKRLQLLKDTVPALSQVAVLWNPLNPAYGPILNDLETAARTMAVELRRLEVRVPEEFRGPLHDRRENPCRCADYAGRSFGHESTKDVGGPGAQVAAADDGREPGDGDIRGPPILRAGYRRLVSAFGGTRGQDPQRGQTSGSAEGAAH